MKTIIDLSHIIQNNMAVHPYDGVVKVYEDKTLDKDRYNNSRLETGMHAGTYIDAPRHFLNSDRYISDFALEQFVGSGCLLDVRGENIISFKEEYYKHVQENDIVLLFTGFSLLYGEVDYYERFNNHPIVDIKLADFFVKKKIKMLGMDMPKPDNYPFEIHKLLLNNNIFIMENLTNLEGLLNIGSFEVIAFPLEIRAEASIVRAVARF
jgi:kynurenine formamidase